MKSVFNGDYKDEPYVKTEREKLEEAISDVRYFLKDNTPGSPDIYSALYKIAEAVVLLGEEILGKVVEE